MSLDIFQSDAAAALADASRRIAPDLTAGFGDAFDSAYAVGTEWHNSIAKQFAKEHALDDYIADVQRRTGVRLPANPAYLIDGSSLDEFNAAQDKLNQQYPVNLTPLTADDIDRMALRRMARTRQAGLDMDQREHTWGGTFGGVLGSLKASMFEPVILATLPLGGAGSLGILGRTAEFAAIGFGTEAGIALASAPAREEAVPGSIAKEVPGQLATSTLFGGGAGLFFGTLGRLLKAADRPLPTSLRDEANVATSEAQINATNIFPTVEGENAGRDALNTAMEQAVKGEPVTAGNGFDPAHTAAFAESAGAKTSDEIAAAGEQALRPLTWREAPDVERFDPIPGAGEDAATYWERWLETASPEERAAVGATDTPASAEAASEIGRLSESPSPSVVPFRDPSPAQVAKLSEASEIDHALMNDLLRIRADNPDMEFNFQTLMPDGSYRLDARKLDDVLNDLNELEQAGKEIEACAIGLLPTAAG